MLETCLHTDAHWHNLSEEFIFKILINVSDISVWVNFSNALVKLLLCPSDENTVHFLYAPARLPLIRQPRVCLAYALVTYVWEGACEDSTQKKNISSCPTLHETVSEDFPYSKMNPA